MASVVLLFNLVQLGIVRSVILELSLFSFLHPKIFKNLSSQYLVLIEDFLMIAAKVKLSFTFGLRQSYLLVIDLLLVHKSGTVHLKW